MSQLMMEYGKPIGPRREWDQKGSVISNLSN